MKEESKDNLLVTKVAIWMFFSLIIATFSCQMDPEYDVVIKNCQAYRVEKGVFDQCNIAIINGKIVAIGTQEYKGKEVIDVHGKYLYPGFIDAHCHFVGYANTLLSANLVGAKSFEEVLERVQKFANQHPELKYITGRGWDQNLWAEKDFPSNHRLNDLFPNIPVLLTRIDGHAALANEAALQLASPFPKTVEGGTILYENGKPTGMLIDMAVDLIKVPETNRQELNKAMKLAEENCFALGLTGLADAGLDRHTILMINDLQRKGYLQMPIYAMVTDKPEEYETFFRDGPLKTDRLSVRAVKVYGDGALGSRGALLLGHYEDEQAHRGLMLKNPSALLEICRKAKEAGFQVNVHAIGDSANRLVLQTFAKTLPAGNDLRWRIEHCQVVNPADGHFFTTFGIIPSVQPTHATSDMYWAEKRLGPQRIKHAYSYRDLMNWRGMIALGTDFPVEEIDPRKTIYASVTRQDAQGFPKGGFLPAQRLTRQETLKGMTIWAAFAQFEEHEKGSIDVGKWADFFLSSTNLMECNPQEILSMPILQTWVHGEVVYQKSIKSKTF